MGWLIVLAVLVLLAWLPLGVLLGFDSGGFSLKVKAGPIGITVLPGSKEKKAAKKKPRKKKEDTPASKQPAKQKTKETGGSLTDFLPVVQTALALLNGLRKKLRINRLELKLILAADDPCDLAVNYGRAWAAVGNLLPLLERCFVIKKRDVEVECDFESTRTLVIAHLDISITLGRLLWLLTRYGCRALKQMISIQNKRKGGKTV